MSAQNYYTKKYALIVGIDDYLFLSELKSSVKGAKMISNILKNQFGFNVVELYNSQATRENILKEFDKLRRSTSTNDAVLFFFAGHGITIVKGQNTTGFIMPYDGVKGYEYRTGISTIQLNEFQKTIPAKHMLMIIDACYSGTIFTRGIGLREYKNKARIAITAGKANEQIVDSDTVSGGLSYLTFYLLKALNGEADKNRDGILTSSELADYIVGNVESITERQHPQYGRLEGDEGGEFIFVLPPAKTAGKISEGEKKPLKFELKPISATVSLNSIPPDALIYVNNKPVGKTPLSLTLAYGSYRIKAFKPGYEDSEMIINISDETPLSKTFILKETKETAAMRIYQQKLSSKRTATLITLSIATVSALGTAFLHFKAEQFYKNYLASDELNQIRSNWNNYKKFLLYRNISIGISATFTATSVYLFLKKINYEEIYRKLK